MGKNENMKLQSLKLWLEIKETGEKLNG